MLAKAAQILAMLALLAPNALAAQPSASTLSSDAQFERFAPREATVDASLDYSWWNTRMRKIVMSMGPSNRSRPGKPLPTVGSSILWGHTSPYRLEGTRMAFSLLEPDVIESFTKYRRDLEQIADRIDIPSLPRDEQLAYWTNLHNVAIAEQIAIHWPVREPRNIRIAGAALHSAQIITIDGVRMSPKDIRTRIVYPHWRDPRVIYGFWHGNIGGPSLQREAFEASNVSFLLDIGAVEFVNSLRGTQRRGDRLLVSNIYEEAAPFYFPDFAADLRAHLSQFSDEEVSEILAQTSQTTASISVPDIADLAGGMREPNTTPVTINGRASGFRVPPSVARLLTERATKLQEMGRERLGTVRVHRSPEAEARRGSQVQ